MKKAEAFKILCSVDTCVIIYPMWKSGDGLVRPKIWPPDSKEVERFILRYRSEAVDHRAKHATGLREFFTSQKKKIDTELAEAHKANWEAKYPVSDEILRDLSEPQLRLATMMEKRVVETVAPSDGIVPHGVVDLHASDAGFMQDGVVEAGPRLEFLYLQLDQSMSIPHR
ncbi:hypothetical protein ACJRO7_024684 [Eucalyptus globulus]|uniref:MADS-box domain-containing protein n=1 Tax=Eucalyptus globulus TaxID=34317 RepID=A0ABD3KAY5_EUCGL